MAPRRARQKDTIPDNDGRAQRLAARPAHRPRTPRPDDVDGDGQSDLLWRHGSSGATSVWFMNGTTMRSTATWAAGTEWTLRGTGDFNDDGVSDLLWVNPTSRQVSVWQMRGAAGYTSATYSYANAQWSVAGVGDFDKDGASDILWRNGATYELSVWRSNVADGALVGATFLPLGDAGYWSSRGASFALRAVGDFNGDGDPDLLWQTVGNGAVRVDFVRDRALFETLALNASQDAGWVVRAVGDYDMNGHADVAWMHTNTRQVSVWLASGFNVGEITAETEEFSSNLPFTFQYVIASGATAGASDQIVRTEF